MQITFVQFQPASKWTFEEILKKSIFIELIWHKQKLMEQIGQSGPQEIKLVSDSVTFSFHSLYLIYVSCLSAAATQSQENVFSLYMPWVDLLDLWNTSLYSSNMVFVWFLVNFYFLNNPDTHSEREAETQHVTNVVQYQLISRSYRSKIAKSF